MALYLGSSDKLKINLNNVLYNINLFSSSTSITDGIRLLTFDNCTLKDANGLYITLKEGE